jgi:cytoskeleton protein RodZ
MSDSATNGARLKAERERRGLSSQKAADELHLDGWVIDALEAEDYGRIGPAVYAKGHLKRYAALLGLPVGEFMAAYESLTQTQAAPAPAPANVRLQPDEPAAELSLPPIASAAAALLLVIALVVWRPWQHHAPPAGLRSPAPLSVPSPAPPPAASPTLSRPPPPTVQAPAAAPANLTATPTKFPTTPAATTAPAATHPPARSVAPAAQGAPPADTAGAGRARLRLSFSADSMVEIHDAAGRVAFAGNGRANTVKTIAGTAPMHVYLGYASGVQLEVNDRAVAIGRQFVAGDVARFEAGADGVLRRESRSMAAPASTAPTAASRNARPTG